MAKHSWHSMPSSHVLKYWETDTESGLSAHEARERLRRIGPNRLQEDRNIHPFVVLARQFQDVIVLILVAAAAMSVVLGERLDALTIGAIVLLNGVLGFFHEYRAEKAVAALQAMTAPTATVLRDGNLTVIPAAELVPGDIIELESGDRVPADARLLETVAFEAEEAALTGESEPVTKDAAARPSTDAPLGDRENMVFQGTSVVRGRGRAVVVATGMQTEVGRLADLMNRSEEGETPLQARLRELGRWLVMGCGLVCVLMVGAGLATGQPTYVMILAGVSLAVAAIPEGLPAIVTILLGLGVQRMARKRAVVRRLPAVETLGCTTVICSDKTGTLTQNRMTLREVWLCGESSPRSPEQWKGDRRADRLFRSMILCNNARLRSGPKASENFVDNPTERALLEGAEAAGRNVGRVRREFPRIEEFPFDPTSRRMAVLCRSLSGWELHVKGAPESVLVMCSGWWDGRRIRPLDEHLRRRWLQAAEQMADRALRVLAVAYRAGAGKMPLPAGDVQWKDLILLGLVGMIDPPRPEAREALARCEQAGIHVMMVTGDHRRTALAIARELGLAEHEAEVMDGVELDACEDDALEKRLREIRVFARVSPEHKLRIVRLLRRRGEVVAMTGDGANDAPAVREADIGVSMGRSGTEVTREAADLVLLDDNFETIVRAVEEGRAIYGNIRKFVRYLLASNTGEVIVMFSAVLAGLPLPLLPIQILFINLVTDGLPAAALGLEPPERDAMNRPPRSPQESLFAGGFAGRILRWGFAIGFGALALFLMVWEQSGDVDLARSVTLASLVMSQMFHVLDCRRERRDGVVSRVGGSNPSLWLAIASTLAALLAGFYWPPLATAFRTVPPSPAHWFWILATSGGIFLLLGRSEDARTKQRTARMGPVVGSR